MNKQDPFYREIKALITVSPAEATIAWFCSGKRQSLITSEVRFPVYADGISDCTDALQKAVNCSSVVYLPTGNFSLGSPIISKYDK